MDAKNLTYGIVGLGIMGGSIAKSIRRNVLSADGSGKILACDKNPQSLEAALTEGVIDGAYGDEDAKDMLRCCDCVFVCLYPRATLSFLKANKAAFKSGAVVTDISGVKNIFENETDIVRRDVDFIVGHPMAGGEKEGYANASADFFLRRNYILVPRRENKAENLDFMRALIHAMGFSRITETTFDTHDYKIAFTSQLCHIIASALVLSAEDDSITAFGGGSFEDLTRIAMINAPLWTELFLSNKKMLLAHIERFCARMTELKSAIETEDAARLCAVLEDTRAQRTAMNAQGAEMEGQS
ncbi:MAG: prephenate dehydrogenase [Treponema sp.]